MKTLGVSHLFYAAEQAPRAAGASGRPSDSFREKALLPRERRRAIAQAFRGPINPQHGGCLRNSSRNCTRGVTVKTIVTILGVCLAQSAFGQASIYDRVCHPVSKGGAYSLSRGNECGRDQRDRQRRGVDPGGGLRHPLVRRVRSTSTRPRPARTPT